MKRGFSFSPICWILLALTSWVGVSPRMWCSGPAGHVELESALSACCGHIDAPCVTTATTPTILHGNPSPEPGDESLSLTAAQWDHCSDSLVQQRRAQTGTLRRLTLSPAATTVFSPTPIRAALPTALARPPARHGGCRPTPLDLRTTLLI